MIDLHDAEQAIAPGSSISRVRRVPTWIIGIAGVTGAMAFVLLGAALPVHATEFFLGGGIATYLFVTEQRSRQRPPPRRPSEVAARLYTSESGVPLPARTKNIGPGGACVATDSSFPMESARRLELQLGSGWTAIEVSARWRGHSGSRVLTGMQFERPSPRARADIERWISTADALHPPLEALPGPDASVYS